MISAKLGRNFFALPLDSQGSKGPAWFPFCHQYDYSQRKVKPRGLEKGKMGEEERHQTPE
jgi:hypothetical protein